MKKYFDKLLYQKAYSRAFFGNLGLAFKELSVVFLQFFYWKNPLSILRVIKYAIYSLGRMIMGRSVRLSYAYTGEDRLIESLLNKSIRNTGFYVDVGCNHPIFISNTFTLYRKGWKGICIDGNEKLIRKYKYLRPRDRAVHAVVSDKQDELAFVEYTNNVLSSVEPALEEQYLALGQQVVKRINIKPQSLTSILNKHNTPKEFDLLTIDAEEHDLNVLQSLDFNKYQPELIVAEIDDLNLSAPNEHPVYKLLTSQNYKLVGFILKNAYFKKIPSF